MDLQRMLNMTGYNMGTVDGVIGSKTQVGLIKFINDNRGKLTNVIGSKSLGDIEEQDVKNIYREVRRQGLEEFRNPDHQGRYRMYARATGTGIMSYKDDDRTVVHGEILTRDDQDRNLYVLNRKSGTAELKFMHDRDARAMQADDGDITTISFNSGGLNMGRTRRASKAADNNHNPFEGNALAGLAGGIHFRININKDHLNVENTFRRSYETPNGLGSWIRIPDNQDTAVYRDKFGTRGSFGFHVDGETTSAFELSNVLGDGTAGCIGIHKDIAELFFGFLKDAPADKLPKGFNVLTPTADIAPTKRMLSAIKDNDNQPVPDPAESVRKIRAL